MSSSPTLDGAMVALKHIQHRPLIGRQIDLGVVLLYRFDERIVVGLYTKTSP